MSSPCSCGCELETLKEMAQHIDEVRLVVGPDGLDKLLPAQLWGAAKT